LGACPERIKHSGEISQKHPCRFVCPLYAKKPLKTRHIDEIDKTLAKHYGFIEEELDYIINYDIKYRMGNEWEVFMALSPLFT